MSAYFTVTIDTEEDNWGEYALPAYTVENLRRIPALQEIFNRYGIRPTYLISYPVATSALAVDILGAYQKQGLCEIGTHPHPWNTPPVVEDRTPLNSFISNLPATLQVEKIRTLTDTITRNFGTRPTCYRSGRWGFSHGIARHLIDLGYTVDTSIHPVWDWSSAGGPDFSHCSHEPFVFQSNGSSHGRSILEVPPSVDFLQSNRPLAISLSRAVFKLPAGNRVAGVLDRLGLLNHVSLSPEMHRAPAMIRLARTLIDRGAKVVNMFFHSPSLLEGCSPFVRSKTDAAEFLGQIETFSRFAQSVGLRSATMSELTAANVGASTVRYLATQDAVSPASET
jgi:hypothetical protein